MKRIIAMTLALIVLMGGIFVNTSLSATAESEFYFKDTMSKEVLRNYVSRAVSHQCLIVSNTSTDPLFEEDMRMLRRIGAKYIGRAATFSWGGNMSADSIDAHFKLAKQQADKAHALDPEMILQAGIFEIAYKSTVNNCTIPAYVFEAFSQPVTERKFKWENIVFPAGTLDEEGNDVGVGCWGNNSSGVPDITKLETKMYFYYLITRYIDAGFEAFHMGQAEKMMRYEGNGLAHHWYELLTKARAYAKKNARRGVAVFDCHTAVTSGGIKVKINGEDHLVFDIQGAGIVPNEVGVHDNDGDGEFDTMKCEVSSYEKCWLSWVGRSDGGKHPLGFDIEQNFTILEFDNYGNNERPGVATPDAFYNWGFDDITWFALQPESYRNQFLIESDKYLKANCLDSEGKQQYFLQPACLRNVTATGKFIPKVVYTPGDLYSMDYIFDYATNNGAELKYSSEQHKFLFTVTKDYRANRNSDICPNGFSQEDTIRKIFLGENAPEDPELLKISLPKGYTPDPKNPEGTTSSNSSLPVSPSGDNSFVDVKLDKKVNTSSFTTVVDGEVETSTVVKTITKKAKGGSGSVNIWLLVGIGAAAVLVGGAATFLIIWLILKKKKVNAIQPE